MNFSLLRQIAAELGFGLVAIALIFIYYPNIPLWSDIYQGVVNTPVIYAALILCAAVAAVFQLSTIKDFLTTTYAKWCLLVLIVYAANYLRLMFFKFPDDDLVVAIDRFQYFLMAPTIGYLVYRTRKDVFYSLVKALAILAPMLVIVDFLYPDLMRSGQEEDLKKFTERSRVSGTWFNANAAGEAIVLSLLLARNAFSRWALALVFTLAGMAMIFTGSRSGMAILAVVGAYLLFQRRLPMVYLGVPIALVIFFSTFLVYIEDIAVYFGRDSGIADTLNRLEYFSGDVEEDESSASRRDAVTFAFKNSLEHPIIGHGIRYVDKVWNVGPHNLVASLAYLYGLTGLLMWLGLCYVLYMHRTTKRWMNPELVVFVWYSMFTHNLLESNYWFIFLALTVYHRITPTIKKRGSSSGGGGLFSRFNRSRSSVSDGRRRKRRQSMRW